MRGSRLSTYVGGSQTASYRQIGLGKGQRFDFTKVGVDGKTEAKYEFEKFGSIGYQLQVNKSKSTRNKHTFGTPYSNYETSMYTNCLAHYRGKGVSTHNGIGPKEFESIQAITKFSASRLPKVQTQDRGLFSPSVKQLKAQWLGPGSYTDATKDAF
jgi:hypothetical protein